jgi:hypothetical protein
MISGVIAMPSAVWTHCTIGISRSGAPRHAPNGASSPMTIGSPRCISMKPCAAAHVDNVSVHPADGITAASFQGEAFDPAAASFSARHKWSAIFGAPSKYVVAFELRSSKFEFILLRQTMRIRPCARRWQRRHPGSVFDAARIGCRTVHSTSVFHARRKAPAVQFSDQASVSLTCPSKKKSQVECMADHRETVYAPSARSECDADLEPPHDQQLQSPLLPGPRRDFVRATVIGTIRSISHFYAL